MDEALQFVIEMNQCVWNAFKGDLKDVTGGDQLAAAAASEHH